MQLSIREVAQLLDVSEQMVYRWLDDGEIPACRVEEDVRFNRAELLEWATLKRLPLSLGILKEPDDGSFLAEAIRAGGVRYDVPAVNRQEALRAMVSALRFVSEEDRTLLAEIMLARGDHAVTPIGEGIAIPHVRQPAVVAIPRPSITLFFMRAPIDLGAPDEKPVGIFFFILSPTVKVHLQLLSQLAAALRDTGFKAALARRANIEEILCEVQRIEGNG